MRTGGAGLAGPEAAPGVRGEPDEGPDIRALDHENLGGTVYLTLCDAIVKGRFQPNDRLRIRDLAERLGTSVTPVRDAVLRLVQDRALVMRSPRDIRVPILSSAEYLEIRTIRMNLEGLAAETAAGAVDAEGIAALQRINARKEQALAEGDTALATELNQVFHFQLTDIAGMPVLRTILQRLWLQMGPLIGEMYRSADDEVMVHHRVLIRALAARDGKAAAAAIRTDILEAGAPILERIRRSERESL
jgi:DNA-binding GntR family transcriptional regulator